MAKLPAAALGVEVVGVTAKVGAAWVTVTVRVIPLPVRVSIPVRNAPVLPVQLAVTVALPDPLAVEAVNHKALEVTVQLMLDVTVIAKLPSAAVRDEVVGLTVNVGVA
jgi:hypothetical protein